MDVMVWAAALPLGAAAIVAAACLRAPRRPSRLSPGEQARIREACARNRERLEEASRLLAGLGPRPLLIPDYQRWWRTRVIELSRLGLSADEIARELELPLDQVEWGLCGFGKR